MILNNPFSDFGAIVAAERFVGRKIEIKQINNRLFGDSFGNLAIMGLPRIGKSSLAWNGIIAIKEKLLKNKIIPIWIQLGELFNIQDFFDEMLTQATENIEENYPNLATYFNELKDLFENAQKGIERRRYVKKYLKNLKENKIRLIVVIDEFDNAKDIFNLQDFQFLREISYNIEIKISIVTISRKTIQELEPENGSLSNFYQIFDELRLKHFSNEDLVLYWGRITKLGLTISKSYIKNLLYYSGKHPYLLDMINYSIFNQIEQSEINLDEIFSKTLENLKLRLYNEYESIINLMKQEDLDSKLVQLIVGPQYNLTHRDVEKLLKYSLVNNYDNNSYECFAKYFEEYLFLKASEIDIWPLWKETEIEIRSLIKQFLDEKYGKTDWENKFVKGNLNKIDKIEVLKQMKYKNISSFADRASTHLVDYTYPNDMFDCFIHSDWSWFKKIFGKEFKDWKPKFDILSKVRNPIAHNNQGFLTQSELNSATAYCQEILALIQKWKNT